MWIVTIKFLILCSQQWYDLNTTCLNRHFQVSYLESPALNVCVHVGLVVLFLQGVFVLARNLGKVMLVLDWLGIRVVVLVVCVMKLLHDLVVGMRWRGRLVVLVRPLLRQHQLLGLRRLLVFLQHVHLEGGVRVDIFGEFCKMKS